MTLRKESISHLAKQSQELSRLKLFSSLRRLSSLSFLLLLLLSGCDAGNILSPTSSSGSNSEQTNNEPDPKPSEQEDATCRRGCTLECIAGGFSFQLICVPRSYQGEVTQDDIESGVVELIESGTVSSASQLENECAERALPVCEEGEGSTFTESPSVGITQGF
jgi:hypothetical protein